MILGSAREKDKKKGSSENLDPLHLKKCQTSKSALDWQKIKNVILIKVQQYIKKLPYLKKWVLISKTLLELENHQNLALDNHNPQNKLKIKIILSRTF